MNTIKPIQLGKLKLSSNIFYAPLAGCSDLPFRQMSHEFKPGLLFTEMVKMDALVRNDFNTFRLLDYTRDLHPIGAQLCGSKKNLIAQSSRIIEELGFDVIDLNCGCPVDKVTKDGSGSGLLKTPDLIGELISTMVQSVSIPVTVKIRIGWDEENIVAPKLTQIAELAGAKAIFIHGRTRSQAYRGSANWDVIGECSAIKKDILVFGNGDVLDRESARGIFQTAKCDGVLVSRGTLGRPWIAHEIEEFLNDNAETQQDGLFLKSIFMRHFRKIKAYQPERKGVTDLRRVGCWYFRKMEETKKLRESLNRSKSYNEIETLISEYPWETISNI